jgi:hypothetical protein
MTLFGRNKKDRSRYLLSSLQVYVTPSGGYAPVYASMPAGGVLSHMHRLCSEGTM